MTETEPPRAKPGMDCPFHRKDMSKVCHRCPLWAHIRGKHPQSEEIVDRWSCSLALLPMLMIENSQMQRQTGAAVESFRNEMVRLNEATLTHIPAAPSGRLIDAQARDDNSRG